MNEYLAFLTGVVCAGFGGELFVRGSVGLAHWARISPGIIGATVVAFATSSPELSVSVNSALAGKPQITLGDALGSNVVNVALILAIALLISSIFSSRDSIKRDFPVAMAVPVILIVLSIDGMISRLDGFLMMSLFFSWLVLTILEARNQRRLSDQLLNEELKIGIVVFNCLVGLIFLVVAGKLIVSGASGIATSFGITEFIIGATIVAVGTSVPELATTVIAKLRGHDDVSLGTILGSNIFNGLFIVAVAAIIHPINVIWDDIAIALVFGLFAVVLTYPADDGLIERSRGIYLLALYCVYLAVVI
ncbi:MAG: calcium/sodium antiporter [Methylococcaceae bacterium]|nr:calcium/sodium antiporter [Methylococcaceae bacterium]